MLEGVWDGIFTNNNLIHHIFCVKVSDKGNIKMINKYTTGEYKNDQKLNDMLNFQSTNMWKRWVKWEGGENDYGWSALTMFPGGSSGAVKDWLRWVVSYPSIVSGPFLVISVLS